MNKNCRQQGRAGKFLIYLPNIPWPPQRPSKQRCWEQIAIHFYLQMDCQWDPRYSCISHINKQYNLSHFLEVVIQSAFQYGKWGSSGNQTQNPVNQQAVWISQNENHFYHKTLVLLSFSEGRKTLGYQQKMHSDQVSECELVAAQKCCKQIIFWGIFYQLTFVKLNTFMIQKKKQLQTITHSGLHFTAVFHVVLEH